MACTSCHHKHKALDAFTLRQQLHHRDYATTQRDRTHFACKIRSLIKRTSCYVRLTSAGLKSHKSGMLFEA
jgi:hypothetical protein